MPDPVTSVMSNLFTVVIGTAVLALLITTLTVACCMESKNDDKDALSHPISESLATNANSNEFEETPSPSSLKVDDALRKGEQPVEGNKNIL